MFVDDILIFGGGSLRDWHAIKGVIELFSGATGMNISPVKSQFYEAGWALEDINEIKQLLPFDVLPLQGGFKYLGFFLKPTGYKIQDWMWLLRRVEARIGDWGDRFLSIGGRLILTKSVLESLPVYWMSLMWIPRSIMKHIQSCMARFIWSGCKKESYISLANWKYLAKPKSLGGWGLKDLESFGLALNAKNLWRCLFIQTLLHRVVKRKYLMGLAVEDWL